MVHKVNSLTAVGPTFYQSLMLGAMTNPVQFSTYYFDDPIVCCIYSAALAVSTSDKESAAHKLLEDGAGVPCRQVAHPFDDAVASSTICSDPPNEKQMWANGLGPATQWSPVAEGNSRPDSCM